MCMFGYVVHGFAKASYAVVEGQRLNISFQLNVKGETVSSTRSISGNIAAMAGDTASE